MLALQLHPLQSALPAEDLMRLAETTLVTVVNQVSLEVARRTSNRADARRRRISSLKRVNEATQSGGLAAALGTAGMLARQVGAKF